MDWGIHIALPIGAMSHVCRNLAGIKPRTLALKTNSNKNTRIHKSS